MFKLLWKSNHLQQIGISALLRDEGLMSFLPTGHENCMRDLIVSNKLCRPIAHKIHNYKETAKVLEQAHRSRRLMSLPANV